MHSKHKDFHGGTKKWLNKDNQKVAPHTVVLGGHAVVIIGYGSCRFEKHTLRKMGLPSDKDIDSDYWIVKNSWGDNWGSSLDLNKYSSSCEKSANKCQFQSKKGYFRHLFAGGGYRNNFPFYKKGYGKINMHNGLDVPFKIDGTDQYFGMPLTVTIKECHPNFESVKWFQASCKPPSL